MKPLATDIFEVGHIINFPYRATVADLNATMKLNIKLLYDNKEVIQDETIIYQEQLLMEYGKVNLHLNVGLIH